MHFRKRREPGFTLVEIMIVVAIIGLLAAIGLPNFVRAREQAMVNAIQNNLRVIEGAKDSWALENRKATGSTPADTEISTFLKSGVYPPSSVVGETYNKNAVGMPATAIIPVALGTYTANSAISLP